MGILKVFFLIIIFGLAVYIGNSKASQYTNRLKELISLKSTLNIFESKIKFTQSPLEEIFNQIAQTDSEKNIRNLFKELKFQINKNGSIYKNWKKTINNVETNLNYEDKTILIEMGKILGTTDTEGQISNIKITSTFIDKQIEKAEQEKEKNVKLFRMLGLVSGLTIVIILV